jgi:hypothetical protein
MVKKTIKKKVFGKNLHLTDYMIPEQYGNIKTNPNKESNNFGIWFIIHAVIIFFIVTILFENVIIESLAWLLDILSFRYVAQFLLFVIIIAMDVVLLTIVKNMNIINSGLLTTLLYFLVDYMYLSKEWLEFSLINLGLNN